MRLSSINWFKSDPAYLTRRLTFTKVGPPPRHRQKLNVARGAICSSAVSVAEYIL